MALRLRGQTMGCCPLLLYKIDAWYLTPALLTTKGAARGSRVALPHLSLA